jgi:type I restriction enzyme R subunit
VNDLEACVLLLEPEGVRADFHSDFKKFSQSMDVVLPDPRAQPYLPDLKRFGMILKAAKNRYREEQLNLAGCGEKVQKIIDEHIRSTNIKILVEPVSILSEKFQEALDSLKSEKSKASEMQHAIQHEISVKIDEDPVFYRSLKERLEEIIEMYTQNRIDLAEKIMRLKALYNEVRERPNLALKMGLNSAELAFFNLLKDTSHEIGIEDDREIVKFTYEVLEAIEPYVTLIDWHHKSDILRQIRKASKLVFHQKDIEKSKQSRLAHQIEELAKVHFPSK